MNVVHKLNRGVIAACAVFAFASPGPIASAGVAPADTAAKAVMKDAKGQTIGQVELTGTPNGVLMRVRLTNAVPGVHAFHVHAIGKCDAPSFESAGDHFNPGKTEHGFHDAKGPHAGDLPNLHVMAGGKLDVEILAPGVTLEDGAKSLFDADGSALVLHAAADDYRTDPAGAAGDRLACGAITR